MFIKVIGGASGKVTEVCIQSHELDKPLLFFLREKGFPIAYSCDGHQQCKKCKVNEDLLSCSYSLEDFLKISTEVRVSYL